MERIHPESITIGQEIVLKDTDLYRTYEAVVVVKDIEPCGTTRKQTCADMGYTCFQKKLLTSDGIVCLFSNREFYLIPSCRINKITEV